MMISLVTRAFALSLFATVASAQTVLVPTAPSAAVSDTAPSARTGSTNMLAALARVEPGLYTNNEMIRIQQARSAGDTATLRFFLSHDNRAATGTPLFPDNQNAAPAPGGPASE